MSAQELTVYVPDGGKWLQRTGNICYFEGETPYPDISTPARRLPVHERFDVTEIPGAMAKMGWHTSAALLNKWFHCSPDTSALEKAAVFFRAMLNYGMPDDLAGALGGFGLYVAPAKIRIRPPIIGSGTLAEVTHIAIYVKNPYSFFDDPIESASQYLGHWNRDGICLVPEGYVAQWADFSGWSNYIIQPEGPYGRTYWPVHNSDFRRWQDKHDAGGDMILFSDYRIEKVSPTIKVRI